MKWTHASIWQRLDTDSHKGVRGGNDTVLLSPNQEFSEVNLPTTEPVAKDPRAAILMTPVNETRKYRCSITGLSQGSMSCFVVEEVVYLNVSLTHRFCFRFADIRSFTFFIPLE